MRKYVHDPSQSCPAGYVSEAPSRLVAVRSKVPVEYMLPGEGGEIVKLRELNGQTGEQTRT